MSKCFNTVKDANELNALTTFIAIARKVQPDDIQGVYKYFRPWHGLSVVGIRFELKDQKSFTYNILEDRYKNVIGAIDHAITHEDPTALKWLSEVNPAIGEIDFRVGSRPEHRFGSSPMILHPLLKNINPAMIEIKMKELEPKGIFNKDLTTGDIEYIDKRFQAISEKFGVIAKRIKASCAMIDSSQKIVKDHDLYFAFYTDFEQRRIGACLTKVFPHLGGNTQIINEHELDLVGLGYEMDTPEFLGASNIQDACAEFEVIVNELYTVAERYPDLYQYIVDNIKNLLIMISNHTEMVYRLELEAARPKIEEVANKIYSELGEKGHVGLDINSWKVWDYENPEEPVEVKDLNYMETILDDYTPTFVDALSVFLRDAGNPLIRPYSKRTVVTDEADIAKTPIGAIRINKD